MMEVQGREGTSCVRQQVLLVMLQVQEELLGMVTKHVTEVDSNADKYEQELEREFKALVGKEDVVDDGEDKKAMWDMMRCHVRAQ